MVVDRKVGSGLTDLLDGEVAHGQAEGVRQLRHQQRLEVPALRRVKEQLALVALPMCKNEKIHRQNRHINEIAAPERQDIP